MLAAPEAEKRSQMRKPRSSPDGSRFGRRTLRTPGGGQSTSDTSREADESQLLSVRRSTDLSESARVCTDSVLCRFVSCVCARVCVCVCQTLFPRVQFNLKQGDEDPLVCLI